MIEKINEDLQKIDLYFRENDPNLSERERIFSRIIKLNEEVGELCEAVLFEQDGNQRQKDEIIDLDSELADIMIVTLLIASQREKNIWNEVNKKLEKKLKHFNLD